MTDSILAIDFATRTGWARHVQGVIDSGVKVFPKTDAGNGHRFYQFEQWLKSMTFAEIRDEKALVDRVVYEKPLGRYADSQAQVYLAVGFATEIQKFCYRNKLIYEAVPIGEIKRFAAGKWRATKAEMIEAVNRRWPAEYEITDDNEADARALLAWAMEARN